MILIKFILPLIISFLILALSILILIKGSRIRSIWAFCSFLLCCSFWVFSVLLSDNSQTDSAALLWSKIAIIGPLFIPSTFLYISFIFPFEIRRLGKLFYLLIFSPAIFSLLLVPTKLNIEIISREEWGTAFVPGPLYYFLFGYFVLYLGLAFVNFWRTYRNSNSLQKGQILYLVAGLIFAVTIGISTNLILPLLGQTQVSVLGPSFSILILSIFFAYSIFKHYLFNIRLIATEFLTGLIVFILFIRIFVSKSIFEFSINISIFLLSALFSLLLIRSTFREIKHREELEKITEKLAVANEELIKLDKAKSEFVSIASHQLRTPLTAIKGYISMVLDGTYGKTLDKVRRPLSNVYASNERLIKLVNDLLNLSRIESGKIQLELQDVQIEKLVQSVLDELQIKAHDKKLELIFPHEKEALPLVKVDESKIRNVIMNLVDNAIRYTEKGSITVFAENLGQRIQVRVVDTGAGMEGEDLEELFESFSRGQAGTQLWTEGTGLGLYVARQFVEMHGGKVWAESEGKGKGSTFYVELPMKTLVKGSKNVD